MSEEGPSAIALMQVKVGACGMEVGRTAAMVGHALLHGRLAGILPNKPLAQTSATLGLDLGMFGAYLSLGA